MKSKDYDLIIFDWDGTLMDSAEKIICCFRAAIDESGLSYPGDAAIRNIIGLGLQEAVNTVLPDIGRQQMGTLIERYREHFLHLDHTEMPFFDGVPEGLESLQNAGYLLAIATGKARRGLNRILDQADMQHRFIATRCADEAVSKPHPQMIADLLVQTGVSSDKALMVGDTTYDLQMAQRAGAASLAVSYGAHDRDRLLACEPLGCCDSFEEVRLWLQ